MMVELLHAHILHSSVVRLRSVVDLFTARSCRADRYVVDVARHCHIHNILRQRMTDRQTDRV